MSIKNRVKCIVCKILVKLGLKKPCESKCVVKPKKATKNKKSVAKTKK
jgi:hypothetical protein